MHVKICGLTLPEHAAAAHEAGVAFVGLMFATESRRRVTVEQARRVTEALPPREAPAAANLELAGDGLWFERCARALTARIAAGRPLVVGVFADQPPSLVNSIAEAADVDLIQLSGHEPWEMALALRRPVIKTLRAGPGVSAGELLASAEAGTAVLCLLDAHVPGQLGGTGERADWGIAAVVAQGIPLVLAGGLDAANVGEAIGSVRPWAVDVSSGVERDGIKDPALIAAFVQAARTAEMETVVYGS